MQRRNARIPLGRMASPQEAATAVVFLASPRASYVTAAAITLDGAMTPSWSERERVPTASWPAPSRRW